MRLFGAPEDYRLFLRFVRRAQNRTPVRCLAYCVMPNHFHLVLWPRADGDLSQFMFWLTTMHARSWQRSQSAAGLGYVYQGRYKALPVSEDGHLLTLCRYVEQNPLRAGLVSRAEDWGWSSLSQRHDGGGAVVLSPWPVPRPDDWLSLVNQVQTDEAMSIRQAIRRNAPYGPEPWRAEIATRLGLERSVAPIGRPRKTNRVARKRNPVEKATRLKKEPGSITPLT